MRPSTFRLLRACAVLSVLCSSAARGEPASCPQIDFTTEMPPIPSDPKLVLNADKVDFNEGGQSSLSGSVRVSQSGREFAAEKVDYSEADQRLRTDSQTLFRDTRYAIRSGQTDYDLKLGSGVFLNNDFTLRSINGRGVAGRMTVAETGDATLERVRFTTCAPGNEAWTLSASTISLDQDSGRGEATNALLRFQGVPLFYLPWFQFPIDGLRHSGFLFPIVGNNQNTGFDIRWPVYLNLGSNYDVTLIPRYLSERGAQIGGEGRYLLASNEGSLFGEYLPSDDKLGGDSRSYIDYHHVGALSRSLGVEAKYGYVSDRNYFATFGGGVDLTSTPFLERGVKFTYQAPTVFRVEALVQQYQTLATTQTSTLTGLDPDPYTRLPQIRVDGLSKNSFLGTRAGLFGEFTNFARAGSVEGQRVIAQPYLRWEHDQLSWYANAQGDLSYTAYNLTDTAAGVPDAPRRTLPLLSAEGGLRFERLTGSGNVQTLEPKLFYLYVPYRDQSLLPLFDSGLPDFDFPQLFARNRYSGYDRVSDANQLTTAVTSRLIESGSGIARLSATLGQIYYFRGPRVDLPNFATPSEGASNFLGNLEYQLSSRWSATGTTEVSSSVDRVQRSSVALRYRDPEASAGGRRFDLAYRYRLDLLEQADASFSTPITDAWRLAARMRYSLRDDSTLEAFGGAEYQTCCWAVSATYRRYLVGGVDRFNNGFYVQLELKGLTRIGNGFERLLPNDDFDGDRRSLSSR